MGKLEHSKGSRGLVNFKKVFLTDPLLLNEEDYNFVEIETVLSIGSFIICINKLANR